VPSPAAAGLAGALAVRTGALAVRSATAALSLSQEKSRGRETFFQRVDVEECFRAVGEEERPEIDRIFIGPTLTEQGFMG
jgi:hypothetical protein